MGLSDDVRALVAERETLMAEVARIDRELADVRAALAGAVPESSQKALPPAAAPIAARASGVPPFNAERPCARCGRLFTPAQGASGRFCSRSCYATTSAADRRQVVLTVLREKGPMFPSGLRDDERLATYSTSTINNDLLALSKARLVRNEQHGWVAVPEVPASPGRPLDQRTTTKMGSVHH